MSGRLRQGRPVRGLMAVALIAAAIGVATELGGLLRPLEMQSVAARFAVRGARRPRRDVVVVGVDAHTLQALHRRWPFPRRLHARVIDRLRAAGARVIAFDVEFVEPTDRRDDNALIRSVRRAGNLVLATVLVGPHGSTPVLGGDAVLHAVHAVAGYASFPTAPGGLLARELHSRAGLPSFAVVAARRAGHAISGAGPPQWIDYAGPPNTFRIIPYVDVLTGRAPPSAFRGKIVVVGAAYPALGDRHVTTAATTRPMDGPEIQANAIATALDGFPLRDVSRPVRFVLILALALLPPLLGAAMRPVPAGALIVAVALAYLLAAQLAFDGGTVLPVVRPLSAWAVAGAGVLAVLSARASFEREHARRAFARFVPEAVAAEVVGRLGSEARLGGVRRDATVLFSDLRGFTSFAEQREPEQVIEVLNRYLTALSDAILDEGGTLVTYLGDGIMAVFGAPVPAEDHADRALRAATEMEARAQRLGAELRAAGLADGFAIGIGLCSGPVMSGNVGSERRLEYTALGDTTNTAARLQALTKSLGCSIVLTESTRAALREEPPLRPLGPQAIRGRSRPLELWAPDGSAAAGEVAVAG